ncbi:MAG TPA: STAS domain-containing protein [Phycisphaerae bacterium]|nr:STAS domain-containing protein [Phycisphaerales bacterium]HNO77487.1 STAS domain-containing protein [Phycisphaerae bacterium]
MTNSTMHDNVCVLAVEGELNKSTVDQFRELVDQAVVGDIRDFVVDFADCTGVDSVGLEALTQLHRECQERLGMCKLCTLSEPIEKVMEVTRLDKQLDLCVTLDEAMTSLS